MIHILKKERLQEIPILQELRLLGFMGPITNAYPDVEIALTERKVVLAYILNEI